MEKLKHTSQLDHVKTVLTTAKAALTGIGIPGVEAIPAIPLEIIAMYEAVKANEEDLKDLVAQLDVLNMAVLEPLQKAQEQSAIDVPEDVRTRVDELCKQLNTAKQSLLPFQELGSARRFLKRAQIAAALKDANRSIGRAIAVFQLGGLMTVELLVRDVRVDIQDHDAESVLSKLNPAHANFRSSQKAACLPNTRSDIIHRIRGALSVPRIKLVCLYGSPGTGKSAVAKSVAARLHAERRLAASYFFDKRGGDTGNVPLETFVSTLVHQFASLVPTFRAVLVDRMKKDPLLSSANADERLRDLFIEPLGSIPPPENPFIIVCDALDECGDQDHQRRLLKLLRHCVESPALAGRVTFFLTSRPEASITDTLPPEPVSPGTLAFHMNQLNGDQTEADIELFVGTVFRELSLQTSRKSVTPEHCEVVEFAALAGGLFELAAIRLRQVQFYCEDLHTSLGDALRRVKQTIRPVMAGGSRLDEAYAEILMAHRNTTRSVPSEELLLWYRSIVGALTCLREPIGISDLAALVGLAEDNARTALRPLKSVISVPDNGPVHFYHTSFLDFLQSAKTDHPSVAAPVHRYLLPPIDSDTALAKRSLILMNQLLQYNILNLADPSVDNRAIHNLPRALSEHIPVCLRYACRYWADHLRPEDASVCRNDLAEWCDRQMVFYLEALSLFGELERAVPLLRRAEEWADKAAKLPQAATLLNDARRLVQMFNPLTVNNAHAIYSSALQFMPSCSFHERYSHLASREARLLHGRLPSWPVQLWTTKCEAMVLAVAVSPKGDYIASGSFDYLVRILSASTGATDHVLRGHLGPARSVAFSSDGKHVVSGSDDRSVRIWSILTGIQERELKGHNGSVTSVVFSSYDKHIVSGSSDCSVRVWSTAFGALDRVLVGHTGWVTSVAVSADGALIVSGSRDRSVRLWSAATGEQTWVLEGHTGWVRTVALSLNGERIVSGGDDRSIRVWSAATGKLERVLEGHSDDIKSVAVAHDGSQVVSGSDDRSVRVWSVATGKQMQILTGHSHWVNSVAFSPDAEYIVSGSRDCLVRAWSAHVSDQELPSERQGNLLNSCTFSDDGKRIVSGVQDSSVCIWSAATGEMENVLIGCHDGVHSVAISPDGAYVAAGSGDCSVLIWSATTGKLLHKLKERRHPATSIVFSLNSRVVRTRSDGYTSIFYDANTGAITDWQRAEFPENGAEARLESEPRSVEDGWLRFNGRNVWLPRYLQGGWHSALNTVVVNSEDSPGRLAFIYIADGS